MKKVAHSSLLADLPARVVDPSAETVEELAVGYGCSKPTMALIAKERVASGQWEQVWKMGIRQLVRAYRRKEQQ